MPKTNYLVTVVVPTHNRSKYAIACIQGLLEIASSELQIVVHDTSNDECLLAQWASSQSDSRLLYLHWSERLSMTENHEHALALAEGEYICLIGDDDCVSSWIVQVAEFARENSIACLTPSITAMYSWPDFRTRLLGRAHAGRLYLDSFDGALESRESRAGLRTTLRMACQGTDELPKLYHGLVRRDLLDSLRLKHGRVFFGTSPDMSAAIGIALMVERHHVINLPFTLPGASSGSNTGRSAMNKHKGDLEKDEHMQPFKDLHWPDVLPRFFSVETVWAHAAWESLNVAEAQKELEEFSLKRLYALCLFNHWDYRHQIVVALEAAKSEGISGLSHPALLVEYLGCAARYFITKAKRLLNPSASNGREVLGVVTDVCIARRVLDERLKKSEVFNRALKI